MTDIEVCLLCGALPCDQVNRRDRGWLREMIVEVAADLSEAEPFWTAGMLADVLTERMGQS